MPIGKIRRNTPQRMVILEELCASHAHPTAAELFGLVRKKLPRISLGTIYRNLEVLHEDGLVNKLELAGTETRFDGLTTPHYHARCTSCGCVRDLPAVGQKPLVDQPQATSGFRIDGHKLEFFGKCPDCLERDALSLIPANLRGRGRH